MAKTKKHGKVKVPASKRPPHVSFADRVRLGPDVAGVKASTPRGQWAQIVKNAHARGLTLAGALSDAPDPLKERTRGSLATEARKQVTDAYAPARQELNVAESRAQGMADKRQRDRAVYDQWLSQRASEIAAQSGAAQANYQATVNAETQKRDQLADVRSQAAVEQMNQGALGAMGGSAQAAQVAARAAADKSSSSLSREQAARAGTQAATTAQAINLSAIGTSQARQATIEADRSKAINEVASRRLALASEQGKTVLGRWTQLLDKEVDKASANRDFKGLMSQLDVKAKGDVLDYKSAQGAIRQRREDSLRDAATSRQNNQRTTATTRAGQQSSATQRRLDREQKERLARQKAQGVSKSEVLASQKAVQRVKRAAAIVGQERIGKNPHVPGIGAGSNFTPTRRYLVGQGYTDEEINLAVAYAKKMKPSQRLMDALGIIPAHRGTLNRA